MPRIIQSSNFRIKMGEHIDSLSNNEEGYFLVGNGSDPSKSFIVSTPGYFVYLLDRAGLPDVRGILESSLRDIRQKVSDKYRNIRNKR